MRNKQTILLDTNALINFLSGELLETNIVDGRRITISEITEMKIQCNPALNSSERILLIFFGRMYNYSTQRRDKRFGCKNKANYSDEIDGFNYCSISSVDKVSFSNG